MKRYLLLLAALCAMLSGCSWMDGSYVSVQDHQEQVSGVHSGDISASNYTELLGVLEELVESGIESAVINVAEYDQDLVENGMQTAAGHIEKMHPLGAYAVDKITYDIGTGGGQPAISVDISYIHGRSEIRKIKTVADMEAAEKAISTVLDQCSEGVVLLVEKYSAVDLVQMVEDYAEEHPNSVMETPQVAVGIYPEFGEKRVVELKFTYQTSREVLRSMQTQVARVFASAELYITSDAEDTQKYNQLYTFLMERFDYKQDTSITPAYSLLLHGVGDSEAFASVYAAMCRRAGLECRIVSGTCNGEPRFWNQILQDGSYRHVDLLSCSASGQFKALNDDEMQGYVWDYSAYPAEEAAEEKISE